MDKGPESRGWLVLLIKVCLREEGFVPLEAKSPTIALYFLLTLITAVLLGFTLSVYKEKTQPVIELSFTRLTSFHYFMEISYLDPASPAKTMVPFAGSTTL